MRINVIKQSALSLLATLMLFSCTIDMNGPQGNGENEESSINFAVTEESETKAQSITLNELTDIGVYGYYTAYERWIWLHDNEPDDTTPSYFCNYQLEKSENWTYTPLKYWPLIPTKRISFFAYSPYTTGATTDHVPYPLVSTDQGIPTITYTVPHAVPQQIDLLWSAVLDKTNESPHVEFTMNHALAAISISAKYANLKESTIGYGVTINSIKITGIYGEGVLDLTTGQWIIDTSDDPDDEYDLESYIGFPKPELTFNNFVSVPCLPNNTFPNDMLMFIPQGLSNAMIHIDMDFTALGVLTNNTIAELPLATPAFGRWEAGKHYHYELLLTNDFMTIDTSCTPWNNGAENNTTGVVPV